MKLMQWIRMHEAGSRAVRPLGMILVGQAVLAAAALGMDLLKLCGSCGAGDAFHATIAAAGLLGYACLLVLVLAKAWLPVHVGVFSAAGVHAALAGLMLARGLICPICAAAALLAIAAPATLLWQDRAAVRWIARATIPACLLASLVTWSVAGVREARAEAKRAEAREAAQLLLSVAAPSDSTPRTTTPVLHVFESDHCPYCREFREVHAPRLSKDFPTLDIVYHASSGVPWVRRTPTLVLGGELAFEGLPVDYRDLFQLVSRAHGTSTR
jgi:hypothetical protein